MMNNMIDSFKTVKNAEKFSKEMNNMEFEVIKLKNRIALLESRNGKNNGNIVKKLKRKLNKTYSHVCKSLVEFIEVELKD